MRTGVARLPLHGGHCPRWLFPRMVELSGCMVELMVDEYGAKETIKKFSDPYFFQSFGCAIGFDWHSSGLTTTTLGALKVALEKRNVGIALCGGKGATSRKTPEELARLSLSEKKIGQLQYASRMTAKVDSNLVQDGYQLYHHSFFVTDEGSWAVIQQGMSAQSKFARRYHWFAEDSVSFVCDPPSNISGVAGLKVLDLSQKENAPVQKASVDIIRERNITLSMPARHDIPPELISPHVRKSLQRAYELQPQNYEELVSLAGVGAKTLRSLALISDLLYDTGPVYKDPVKYSFTVGGKDGYPYKISTKHYDEVISLVKAAVAKAKLSENQKRSAIRRLHEFI